MAETQQVIQQLTIHLTGGQTVRVRADPDSPDLFDLQIEGFFLALYNRDRQDHISRLEGDHVVYIRLSKVIAAEVDSFVPDNPQSPFSSPENASNQDGKTSLTDDSGLSKTLKENFCNKSDLP